MRDFAGLNNERQIHLGRENRDIEREKSSSKGSLRRRRGTRDRRRAKEEEGTRYKNGERGKKEREKESGERGNTGRRRNRKWNKNEGSYRWRSDLSFDSMLVEKLHLSPAAFGLRIRNGAARKGAPGAFTRDQILC